MASLAKKVSLTNQIRTRLSQYLANPSGESEFQEWFAEVLRNVHASNDPEAEALALAVEWAFLDLERGNLPADDARQNLLQLAGPSDDLVIFGRPIQVGGSSQNCATTTTMTDTSSMLPVEKRGLVSTGRWRISPEMEFV